MVNNAQLNVLSKRIDTLLEETRQLRVRARLLVAECSRARRLAGGWNGRNLRILWDRTKSPEDVAKHVTILVNGEGEVVHVE